MHKINLTNLFRALSIASVTFFKLNQIKSIDEVLKQVEYDMKN